MSEGVVVFGVYRSFESVCNMHLLDEVTTCKSSFVKYRFIKFTIAISIAYEYLVVKSHLILGFTWSYKHG